MFSLSVPSGSNRQFMSVVILIGIFLVNGYLMNLAWNFKKTDTVIFLKQLHNCLNSVYFGRLL